jgi:hypothetical protein
MKVSRTEAAQLFLTLGQEPLRFSNHPYMPQVLNSVHPRKLLKCSRQVGKSVIDCVELLTDPLFSNIPRKNIREVYVSPSLDQTKAFSIEKLGPMIKDSPRFAGLFTDKSCREDVFLYTFTTGAQLYLRAAHRTADRVRGIPADKIVIDELQDMIPSTLPDIIASSLASPYNRIIETGTPKTEDNFIESEWLAATQYEWAIPCKRHSPIYWNYPLSQKHIGKESVICEKCGKPINPRWGKWICIKEDGKFEGYHINQLASTLNMDPEKWGTNIIAYMEGDNPWPQDKFNNEIIGITSGKAEQLLHLEDLKKCEYPTQPCIIDLSKQLNEAPKDKRIAWFGGVDWGEGRDGGITDTGKKRFASYSIFYVGGYMPDKKFAYVHWKKFMGEEASPEYVVKYIVNAFHKFKLHRIACDWGHGWGVNEQVMKALGPEKMFSVFESANLKELYQWDSEAWRYTINRNEFISRTVNSIKRGEVVFPKGCDEMYRDFTAEKTEYSEQMRKMLFIHRVDQPDDSLHAAMYCKIAADMTLGKFSLVQP